MSGSGACLNKVVISHAHENAGSRISVRTAKTFRVPFISRLRTVGGRLNGCYVIYQTRERVFHQDIQTPRSGLKKRGAAEFFFNRVRGVWIPDETLL